MRYGWTDTVALLLVGGFFYSIIPDMSARLTAAGLAWCMFLRGRALVRAEIARQIEANRD